ncbi:MAG: RIP metalloprotease RseP [Acholeplasmataceae bacterium]|nr:RIP metalloprotease RseP [Acholeplasmataceae bacterium]
MFIIVLGVIVAIHELGHLIFAKRAKILCFEYAIGMGPVIYQKKGKETDFSIRAIPIGGFVSMAGEQISTEMIKKDQIIGINLREDKIIDIVLDEAVEHQFKLKVTDFDLYDEEETGLFIAGLVEGELVKYEVLEDAVYKLSLKKEMKIAPYKKSFESKTFLQKFLTLFAGPAMNFILALLLFFVVASFNGKPINNNVVGGTVEYYPAHVAGLKKGDQIVSIADFEITNRESIASAIQSLDSYEQVKIEVKRKATNALEVIMMDLAVEINQLGIANFSKEEILIGDQGAVIGNAFGYGADKLQAGDKIIKVKYLENAEVEINNWYDLVEATKDLDGKQLRVTFIREAETKTEFIHVWETKVLKSQGLGAQAISLGITAETKYNFGYAIASSFTSIWTSFTQVITILGFLFGGSSQIGINDLSGPVGIFNIIGLVMQGGILSLLWFTAFLSVNVGVLNLLPIPVLDGGRIVFITYEAITKRKIPRKVENIIINIFFILMMILFLYVTFNDVLRLIIK